jgi:hypothetical protein
MIKAIGMKYSARRKGRRLKLLNEGRSKGAKVGTKIAENVIALSINSFGSNGFSSKVIIYGLVH